MTEGEKDKGQTKVPEVLTKEEVEEREKVKGLRQRCEVLNAEEVKGMEAVKQQDDDILTRRKVQERAAEMNKGTTGKVRKNAEELKGTKEVLSKRKAAENSNNEKYWNFEVQVRRLERCLSIRETKEKEHQRGEG